MEFVITYLLPIISLSLLAGFWVFVQILAKKVGTKNHFDNAGECGNECTCFGQEHCKQSPRDP